MPVQSDSAPPQLAFSLPPDPARLLRARQRIRDCLVAQLLDADVADAVVSAVEEAMANAVLHSGAREEIEVNLRCEGGDLLVTVKDRGQGFDVKGFAPQLPDLRAEGGRGLYLMAQLMDVLELRCDGGLEVRALKRNVLPITRPPGGGPPSLEAAIPGAQAYRDERQRAFLEEIDEAFVSLDWEYRLLYVNAACERHLGRPRKDLLGRSLWEVCPAAAEQPIVRRYREAMELGRASLVEHQTPLGGGWVEARIYPTSSGISVYLREIDERKRIERERDEFLASLRASEERYRLLHQTMLQGVVFQDADGTITSMNPAAERILGKGPDQFLGSSSVGEQRDTLREDGTPFPGLEHPAMVALRTGRPVPNTCMQVYNPRESQYRLINIQAMPLMRPGEDEVSSVYTVFDDITERRRAEEAMRESEARLRFHLENTPLAVVEWDRDLVVTRWAGEAEAMFGWSAEETLGKPMADLNLIYVDDIPVAEGTIAKLTDGKHTKVVSSNRNYTRDGRVIDCTWYNSALLDAHGRMSSVLSLVEDLTERKATEEVLRETARLDETLTAIDALMHSSLRAGQAVETALREGAEALGAQVGLVTTHAAEGFRIDYLHGGSAEGLGRIVPDEADALGLSVLTGRETLAIGDVGTEARADQWLVQDFHVRSIIVAPLIRGGETTGCLYFAFLEEVHSFSAAEVRFVNRLASSLSLAMENAALYEAQRNIALTLQQAFIHPLPDLDDLEVGIVGLAAWQPALVGGDFWDVFHLRDDKVLIVIGDVSGKGVEAAALTETVHSAVRAFASVDDSPGFILSKTNDLLLADPKIETFVTALVLVLSIGTGKVSLASAGHPGPLRVAEGSCETVDPEYRLPLGIFTTQYPTRELQLGEGEYLALYTDGVTEARSVGELFGEERVKEALRPLWGRPSQDLAAALAGAASSFADSLTDDLQVLVIRRR